MMFCPKCGSLLVPKKNKKAVTCSCGYTSEEKIDLKVSAEVKEKEKIEVVNQEDDYKSYPLTDAECEKCDHDKARFWTVQTRASDEPETKFLRCEKCHHVWRDYS